MSEYPVFKLPIEDLNAAEFWLEEWLVRFFETKDHAFKEAADAMQQYIHLEFDDYWGGP